MGNNLDIKNISFRIFIIWALSLLFIGCSCCEHVSEDVQIMGPPSPIKDIKNIDRIEKEEWFTVIATTFEKQRIASPGLHGNKTVYETDLAAALPSVSTLGRYIEVHWPETGKKCLVAVVDVGPWCSVTGDDPYWETRTEPKAISKKHRGKTNGASLDLMPAVWEKLGVPKRYTQNKKSRVKWRFVRKELSFARKYQKWYKKWKLRNGKK